MKEAWEKWVSTRPPAVQAVATKYPLGTRFEIHGKIMEVISYSEDGTISVTEYDPRINYRKAVANRQPVCKCCVGKLDEIMLPEAWPFFGA